MDQIEQIGDGLAGAMAEGDSLFASLQHRAFRGDL